MKLLFWKNSMGMPPGTPEAGAEWWLARRSLQTPSSAAAAAFEAWRENADNARAYAELDDIYQEIGAFAGEPEILELRTHALKAEPLMPQNLRSRRFAGIGLAFAACLAILGGRSLVILYRGEPQQAETVVGAGKFYETRVGERRKIRLDDGTVVSMNTDSRLEVTYNSNRRDVRLLRGEAKFAVAHSASWPFVVTVGDRQVTAIGTVFNVRRDGNAIRVALVEGSVRVNTSHAGALARLLPALEGERLSPGEQLSVLEGHDKVTIEAADIQRVTSWENGQITFRDETLANAVAEFNRYSERKILVLEPRVSALRLSGVFSSDHPDEFLAAVTAFYPVEARKRSDSATELVWLGGD